MVSRGDDRGTLKSERSMRAGRNAHQHVTGLSLPSPPFWKRKYFNRKLANLQASRFISSKIRKRLNSHCKVARLVELEVRFRGSGLRDQVGLARAQQQPASFTPRRLGEKGIGSSGCQRRVLEGMSWDVHPQGRLF